MTQQEGPKILIVDDEEVIRQMLSERLIAEDYQCSIAAAGKDALEQINKEEFDLILLDVRMPGKSGLEVLRESRALRPDAAVMMVTAVDDVNSAVEAMQMGALDYVVKPFGLKELVTKVAQTLQKGRALKTESERRRTVQKEAEERKEQLEQAGRELRSLNTLFQSHFSKGIEMEEKHRHLKETIVKMYEEMQQGDTQQSGD